MPWIKVPESVLAVQRAERMRTRPTMAENQMEAIVRSWGHKVRPQEIFQGDTETRFYIADLYLPKCRVVLELDGGYHADQEDYDARRDEFIATHGMGNILVLRVPNHAVTDPLFLNELQTFLSNRRIDVVAWWRTQSSTIAAQRRAWEGKTARSPVAAEVHVCSCVECGRSWSSSDDSRKDVVRSTGRRRLRREGDVL